MKRGLEATNTLLGTVEDVKSILKNANEITKEIEKYECKKLIVLQKEDLETKRSIENIKNIEIYEQNKNGYHAINEL